MHHFRRTRRLELGTHLRSPGHQRWAEVIRSHQRPSEVIRGHQWSSAIISSTHLLRLGRASPIERLEERVGCECMLPEGTCHVTRADLMRDAIRGHPEGTSPART